VGAAWPPLLSLTNDGLLTYRRVGGQAGYQLVPDLARSMPRVSEDGKSYMFQLRPNIHYSNGRVVRASDFRYAIERVFKLRPRPEPVVVDSFRAIRGAERCGRQRCDLSAGIATDDAARTVTFHLSAPDPVFLYTLASSPAAAVPVGTSPQEAKRRPLPATGPYRFASFTPNRALRLVRNRHFREWSPAAQPAGFPDELVLKIVANQKTALALVQQGKADLTTAVPEKPLRVPPTFRAQLHTYPTTTTFYLAFDPGQPPFDHLRARQALNYALDRRKVAQLVGGEATQRPTCQVLPPNFPGHRRYCPYTLDPNSEGSWTGADPAKATRLVAASGTTGTPVTLWFTREGGPRLGRYLVALLKSLGYPTRLRSFENVDPYFDSLKHGARPQILWSGWAADYPAASNYIEPLFTCSSEANYAHFCDRALDRKIDDALELQEDDPVGANRLWAALDREITDKAAWVPLYNLYGTDFVSKRVDNYQYNPQWGALLSQIWVR
jgi:peptide/nickel transport system substrate-binding protein